MSARLRATLPLALSVGILAFLWLEISLNFTFHWVTAGDLGNGLALPGNLQLIAPAAFVSWAMFFAAGADGAAVVKVLVSSVIGAAGGLVLMVVGPKVADIPDFWGLALVVGVLAVVVVAASSLGDWYFTPAVFGGFASVVFWWIATGLDGWAPGGGGGANSVEALGAPTTAGTGAFSGVLSTPVEWVFASTAATLAIGVVLGRLSMVLCTAFAAVIAPPAPALADN